MLGEVMEAAVNGGMVGVVRQLRDRGVNMDRSRRMSLMKGLLGAGNVGMVVELMMNGGRCGGEDEMTGVERLEVLKAAMMMDEGDGGGGVGVEGMRKLVGADGMREALKASTGFLVRVAEECRSPQLGEYLGVLVEDEATGGGGVDVNQRDRVGITALHWCSARGEMASVVVLMRARGVDVNARTVYVWTPLHYAAFAGHAEVVRELIEVGGADVNARDSDGDTPLDDAVDYGRDAVLEVLRAHGGVRGRRL